MIKSDLFIIFHSMDYTEIEIEWMKEILRDKEEYIKKLEIDKIHWRDLYWEECEKNKKLKEERDNWEKTATKFTNCIDTLEASIKNLEEENNKLKDRIRELERTDEQLAKKLKSVVSVDNEQMHCDADQLLSDFLRAIWYNKSADQYDEMSKDFRYA